MLVIGIPENNLPFHSDLEIDPDIDSPRKIHDMLMKEANGIVFVCVMCIEEDTVVAEFFDQEDYDLSIDEEEDQEEPDESVDPDGLHEADDGDDEDE